MEPKFLDESFKYYFSFKKLVSTLTRYRWR